MRLIDSDELKDIIDGSENLINWQKDEMKLYVDACDTAYDAERVVEQLENMKLIKVEQCREDYELEVMTENFFEESIEIVKSGGID